MVFFQQHFRIPSCVLCAKIQQMLCESLAGGKLPSNCGKQDNCSQSKRNSRSKLPCLVSRLKSHAKVREFTCMGLQACKSSGYSPSSWRTCIGRYGGSTSCRLTGLKIFAHLFVNREAGEFGAIIPCRACSAIAMLVPAVELTSQRSTPCRVRE